MKLSFSSCLRNWVPFLVYGLIAIAVGVVAVLVMAFLVFAFGSVRSPCFRRRHDA